METLLYYCDSQLDDLILTSKRVRELLEEGGGKLTRDEAMAILAYTAENPFHLYRWLNAWLVDNRQNEVISSSVGPYFRLLYQVKI